MAIATLEISSYIGLSIGAVHYYGRLWFDEGDGGRLRKYDLIHRLTEAEATVLNKRENESKARLYQAGMEVPGFDTERQVKDAALEIYKDRYPGATVLLCGRPAEVGPRLALDGPVELQERSAALVARKEALSTDLNSGKLRRSKFEDLYDDLCDEWDELIAPYR